MAGRNPLFAFINAMNAAMFEKFFDWLSREDGFLTRLRLQSTFDEAQYEELKGLYGAYIESIQKSLYIDRRIVRLTFEVIRELEGGFGQLKDLKPEVANRIGDALYELNELIDNELTLSYSLDDFTPDP